MWHTSSGGPSSGGQSVLASAAGHLRMNHLRARIKKRSSKYSLYKSKRSNKDAGSERVDWVFVGFPTASNSASNVDLDNAPLTFEPLKRTPQPQHSEIRTSASFATPEPEAAASASVIWRRPPEATEPPPLPPRAHNWNRRPPPPRPASLYASLNRVPSQNSQNVQQINPSDEYAQIIRSSRRKRPKSSETPRPVSHYDLEVEAIGLQAEPEASGFEIEAEEAAPPPVPPHKHGSGVPLPLPESPPAPCIPPHATPSPSAFESFNRSHLESPFYRRPMSLASSMSLARSMSSSHLNPGVMTSDRSYDVASLDISRGHRSGYMSMQQDQQGCLELEGSTKAKLYVVN